jgi:hypothetical protein
VSLLAKLARIWRPAEPIAPERNYLGPVEQAWELELELVRAALDALGVAWLAVDWSWP